MRHQEGVITGNATIVWDGFTQPEEKDGEKGKFLQYTLSIVLPANDPTVAELQEILTTELNNGQFKGKFPNGGHWGIKQMDPTQYDGRFPNHVIVKAISYNQSQVFGPDSKPMDPMMYQGKIFSGAVVNLFVNARSYNNVSKGVGFWLSGIRLVDWTTERIAGAGANAAAAFGAAPTVGGCSAPGAPGQFAAPQMGAPVMAPAAPIMAPQMGAPVMAPVMGAPGAAVPGQYPGGPQFGTPGVTPNPAFLQSAGVATPPPAPVAPVVPAAPVHVMLPAAGGYTYEQLIAGGWTDATLVQHGMMQA